MTDDRYVWRYILLLKSFTVYGLDIFVAVTMISSEHVRLSPLLPLSASPPSPPSSLPPSCRSLLLSDELTHIANTQWTTTIARKCGDDCAVPVRFDIAKWIFVGCIIFSFLLVSPFITHLRFLSSAHCSNPCLEVYRKRRQADEQLGYETWKAKNVIDSRDISYAFTNLIANDYYSFSTYSLFHRVERTLGCSGMDADMQKTTILSAYFVILIARPRGRMISLFGYSLRSKVSVGAIAVISTE
jgi:hypothetical protein